MKTSSEFFGLIVIGLPLLSQCQHTMVQACCILCQMDFLSLTLWLSILVHVSPMETFSIPLQREAMAEQLK